ncbi:LCP family protein [Pontibacillus yanchengensis]|uniref:Regulatory protein MsrR n=1 Tax=Pontibacillus yanchengensis Y32 TaxID=1385514 RepID=A0A0A2TYQ3_9BACI|nr:LCP family protein [Pontibacillus yanchengensis]KGP74365.1 transcriptional regulator [Pontibacillus yanchengensis Y32]
MAGSRMIRRQRKRKRKRKLLFSIVIVLILSVIGYSSFQFAAGQDLGADNGGTGNSEKNEETKEDFENRDVEIEKPEDEKINILLVGSDQRGNESARTDTIMIGQYNTDKGTAKLVSIMRDTYVQIPGRGYNKINASYAIGDVALLSETIEKNFGVPIDHYAVVNFEGFKDIIDTVAPNGIEIDVEKRMQYSDNAGDVNINLYPGEQKLNGSQLLDYARFRNDIESDFGRVRRQQQVMSRLKDEMVSFSSITKLPKTAGLLSSYVATDMNNAQLLNYGRMFLMNPAENIQKQRIPVDGSYENKRVANIGLVLSHNEQQNRQAIQDFLSTESEQDKAQASQDPLSESTNNES